MFNDLAKFPFLNSLLKNKVLLTIDLFFAFKFFKKYDENILLALSFLFAASRQGHLCVKIVNRDLLPHPEFLFLEKSDQISTFKEKALEGFLKLEEEMSCANKELKKAVKIVNGSFYLERNFNLESKITERFIELYKSTPTLGFSSSSVDLAISKYGSNLLSKQKVAVKKSIENSISFIFGGPGTGKTFTVGCLINIFSKLTKESKIILTAPTGKAVLNLEMKVTELLDDPSSCTLSSFTLHSLLQVNSIIKKTIKIDADLIIIDEGSMIDAKIFSQLFYAIRKGTRVVIVGDPNQLPPIETGNLFSVFYKLNLEKNAIELDQCMRSENLFLLQISKMVKEGQSEKLLASLKEGDKDIFYKSETNHFAEEIIDKIEKHYLDKNLEKEDPEILLKIFSSFKILTALNEGLFGVNYLNNLISDYLSSKKTTSSFLAYPIIVTKNNYNLELYNGTLGIVIRQKRKNDLEEYAYFPSSQSNIKKIPLFLLSSYELAYVLSIHKSQGSEFDHVLVVLTEGSTLFGRELLYTAITRTKKTLNILAADKTIEEMVNNQNISQNNLLDKLLAMPRS
jgi:exodeoxyribonuclease V alpha subunit